MWLIINEIYLYKYMQNYERFRLVFPGFVWWGYLAHMENQSDQYTNTWLSLNKQG